MAKIYDNPKYDAAFARCIDIMTKIIVKHGIDILNGDKNPLTETSVSDSQTKKDAVIVSMK